MQNINEQEGKSRKPFKKKLLVGLIILAAILLLMYALTLILPYIFSRVLNGSEEEQTAAFNFYEPDYAENIFDDEEYMTLIAEGIYKYDNAANTITPINSENAINHGVAVKFLTEFVDTIINGDSAAYNEFFSDAYYKTNAPKEKFTMQKIYDATITYYSIESVSEGGSNYTKYIYKLKYSIFENNGTFRMDIGEDQKTQYIVITDREGELLIDAISTSKYK